MVRVLLTLSILAFAVDVPAQSRGALVAVGGGGTTDAIVARTLELAGGRKARVVVLPQSSSAEGAGDSSVEMWRNAGAADVTKVDFAQPGAKADILNATLIWIPGGDQNRFMKEIAGTGLDEAIRSANARGVVVGGTSAGAAVLSGAMITGDADLQSLTSGKTVMAPGLGLWRDAIVDQHFLRRQRHNRLLSAVLDRPELVGVGIDEGTAAILRGTIVEVLGRSAVVVIDARKGKVPKSGAGEVSAGAGIRVHVLRSGMSLDLKRGEALLQPRRERSDRSVRPSHGLFAGRVDQIVTTTAAAALGGRIADVRAH